MPLKYNKQNTFLLMYNLLCKFQNLITEEHEAILEMISKHIDKKWKHKSTNRHFINVICKFCTFKRNILSDKLMKVN